jgi:hypothetical protein
LNIGTGGLTMATCKDCVHYDVCKGYLIECAEHGEAEEILNPCANFKNKADFVEVKHGHWIKHGKPYDYDIECSVCGEVQEYGLENAEEINRFKFCTNCGADMRKGENNGE